MHEINHSQWLRHISSSFMTLWMADRLHWPAEKILKYVTKYAARKGDGASKAACSPLVRPLLVRKMPLI